MATVSSCCFAIRWKKFYQNVSGKASFRAQRTWHSEFTALKQPLYPFLCVLFCTGGIWVAQLLFFLNRQPDIRLVIVSKNRWQGLHSPSIG